MLGDLRILDAGGELLLDTERITLQPLFNMIRHYSIGYDVQLHKRTLECGLLSVLGPEADDVVPGVPAREHAHCVVELGARAIRTELGIDLLCAAADTDALK